jgi:hypothetical protein
LKQRINQADSKRQELENKALVLRQEVLNKKSGYEQANQKRIEFGQFIDPEELGYNNNRNRVNTMTVIYNFTAQIKLKNSQPANELFICLLEILYDESPANYDWSNFKVCH